MYQELINLLSNAPNEQPNLRTKNLISKTEDLYVTPVVKYI